MFGSPPHASERRSTLPETSSQNSYEIWPGEPYPLGATFDGAGVNFTLFSEIAEAVELCLFDEDNTETRLRLPESTGFVWHGYVPGLTAGQRYGYRVHGPWNPRAGQRAMASKLLLDPYARAIEGQPKSDNALFTYRFDSPDEVNDQDSAPYAQRSIVVNPHFEWGADRQLRRPLHETIIYETHVKGLTMQHPDVPERLRGTYAGLAHPSILRYLTGLGVTAIELLPIHQFTQDSNVGEKGLRNYWGYNTIGFFAPHNEYASNGDRGEQVPEFKQMVAALHEAGLEVILDVVYNHTAEGNHLGPTLSFKGIDNAAYYRLVRGDERYYMDYTGTGNSLNTTQPFTLQLVMDSLRYWIEEMHVDGFRFDLAVTLARDERGPERLSAFFDLVQQDPVVSQVKLIAEPWDTGEGGYQVGNFPALWSEWNGKYRDTVRDFWRGEPETLGELAYRLTGSSDLYEGSSRRPHASVNFVTAHDGFTLADLVSYNEKHNEANGPGEETSGENHNRSYNYGVEGPTDDPVIQEVRNRQRRNFLTTLLLSQGVPMLLGGDEIGRTQRGNNNAYAQDNEISWYDWQNADAQLLEFARGLITTRRNHPVFRRRRWFQGRAIRGKQLTDIAWLGTDGQMMAEEAWGEGSVRALALFLGGDDLGVDRRGELLTDSSFYLMLNPAPEPVTFRLPGSALGNLWRVVIDTTTGEPPDLEPDESAASLLPTGSDAAADSERTLAGDSEYVVAARALILLERIS